MASLLPAFPLPPPPPTHLSLHSPNPNLCSSRRKLLTPNNNGNNNMLLLRCIRHPNNFRFSAISSSSNSHLQTISLPPPLVHLAASALFFLSLSSARASTSGPPPLPSPQLFQVTAQDDAHGRFLSVDTEAGNQVTESSNLPEEENEEMIAAFERWKSKIYALTVPLRIVALRGSIPPSWIKEFIQSQGKRLKLQSELRGSLESIFSDMALAFQKGHVDRKSIMAADIVTVGDSWLPLAIRKGIIEPISDAEGQNWFNSLDDKWKAYLRRNSKGELDSSGEVWAAPYRWGCLVIAYKKSKFQKHNLAPIEDWKDLWRRELTGKISMIDSPREVIGAVLKCMGSSYNTQDIESQVPGGKIAAYQNLASLQRQVRLFDSTHYLKAFGVGDVWVAVGWSSDVLPAANRMSNVTVVVPKSGTSLWADLWAIPAATKFTTDRIGGRIRGPSPLFHQWIEFCLHTARSLPFQQGVIPGASPSSLGSIPAEVEELVDTRKGRQPKLDTNLIAGVPPPEILAKCEFLEPLSEAALTDYQWLVASMQKKGQGYAHKNVTIADVKICQEMAPISFFSVFKVLEYRPKTYMNLCRVMRVYLRN
ncbi:hypothetical protein ACLOJK_034107 [Asimina triloba]